MLIKIRALPTSVPPRDAFIALAVGNNRPPTATVKLPSHTGEPASSLPIGPASEPVQEGLISLSWEDEVFEDLWSMIDWNIGFPSSDLTSFVPRTEL